MTGLCRCPAGTERNKKVRASRTLLRIKRPHVSRFLPNRPFESRQVHTHSSSANPALPSEEVRFVSRMASHSYLLYPTSGLWGFSQTHM